uniref:Uncharacterized protein n=1 Tax=Zea mays TaxID=4577 RepID=B7ZY33_MAIZE|nr:unknown [Zea mays]
MRAAELHLHVQLRRLAHRHRQPARVQPALQPHRRPLPLRHHLLPPLHRPLLRRPPRRRLPSASVRPAAAAAVPAVPRQGPAPGRQLRRRRRHRHGSALLPGDRRVRQALDQPVPQRPARLVRAAQAVALQLTERVQGVLQQVPLPGRRDRGERLQLRLLQGQDPGRRQDLRPHGRRRGHRCHREADQGRRHAPGGAGEPAHGLLVGVPDPAPGPQRQRLRRRRLPQDVQRLRAAPQRCAPAETAGAPGEVPAGEDHVRRLLRRRHVLRQEPQAVRVHAGAAADVLRRRRAVQLQPEGELRRAGVQRVRGPVGVRQLGRRAPDGGRLPRHRRQHPQRALHQPQAPLIRTPVVEARRPSIGSRSSYNCSGANNVAGL